MIVSNDERGLTHSGIEFIPKQKKKPYPEVDGFIAIIEVYRIDY